MVETLNIAICLFPNVTTLDFQGAVELFRFISPESVKKRGIETSHVLRLTFLSHSLEPVTNSGPGLVPQSTYNDALTSNTQYDIVFVPGGNWGQSAFLFLMTTRLLSVHRRNCTS